MITEYPELLTENEVAKILRVSNSTVSREIKQGNLAACRFRRVPRVLKLDLLKYIEQSRREV